MTDKTTKPSAIENVVEMLTRNAAIPERDTEIVYVAFLATKANRKFAYAVETFDVADIAKECE